MTSTDSEKPKVLFIDRDQEEILPDLEAFHEFFESQFFASEREYQKFLNSDDSKKAPILAIVFDQAMISEAVAPWIEDQNQNFTELGLQSEDRKIRFIMSANESEPLELHEIKSPLLTDILLKPIDPALFVQKMRIFSELPRVFNPSGFYKYKFAQKIEMNKITRMTRFSEHGVTILNPSNIREGVFASFRLNVKQLDKPLKFFGRSRSSHSSEVPNYFNCEFSFFGLNDQERKMAKELVKKLKMSKDDDSLKSSEQALATADARTFEVKQAAAMRAQMGPAFRRRKKKGSAVTASTESTSRPKSVVVVDMDRETRTFFKAHFDEVFPNDKLYFYPNYEYFLRKEFYPRAFLRETLSEEEVNKGKERIWSGAAFTCGTVIKLTLDGQSRIVNNIEPKPLEGDLAAGLSIQSFFKSENEWKKIIHPDSLSEIEEGIKICLTGEKLNLDIQLIDLEKKYRWFEATLSPVVNPDDKKKLDIEFAIFDQSKWNEGLTFDPSNIDTDYLQNSFESIDLLILNTKWFEQNISEWLATFQDQMSRAQMLPISGKVPIIALNSEHSPKKPAEFCRAGIKGFIYKPLERRQMLQNVAITTDYSNKEFAEEYLDHEVFYHNIELGRVENLNELTEYGFSIRSKKPMQKGTLLMFHSPLLTDENGFGTLARCYNHRPLTETEEFISHFLYYGISRKSLLRIRKGIHEAVAQDKLKD